MVPLINFDSPTVAANSDIDSQGSTATASSARIVLIIDDDDAIRALSEWVAVRAGFRVLTARDGPEGLECFRDNRQEIGLVLLDLTMPRMTGAEVVSALHQMGANVPVILITGYGEESVRDDERIGVKAVLQKPFTPDALRAVLREHLEASS